MMTDAEILEQLRRTYVDGVREWDADPDAFSAAVNQRIGCLSIELTRVAGSTVSARSPRGYGPNFLFAVCHPAHSATRNARSGHPHAQSARGG